MKKLRYNELIDLLERFEILYQIGKYDSINIQLPELGSCTYWNKKDRVHIHKDNDWLYNGFYFIRKQLTEQSYNDIISEHEI